MVMGVRRPGPHRSASGARPAGGIVREGASCHRSSGDSARSNPVAMIRSASSSPLSTKSSACKPIVARWCWLLQSKTPFAPQVFKTPIPADTARSCRPGTAICETTPGPANRMRVAATAHCLDRLVGGLQPIVIRGSGPQGRFLDRLSGIEGDVNLHLSGGQCGSDGYQRLGRVHLDREARPRFEPGQPEDAVALVHRGTRSVDPLVSSSRRERPPRRPPAPPRVRRRALRMSHRRPTMTATRRHSSAAEMALIG